MNLEAFPGMSLHLNTLSDLLHLHHGVLAITGSDPFQAYPSLIMPTLLRKPSRALPQSERADAQQASKEHLQPDRNLPLLALRSRDVFCNTPIDPVRSEDTQGEHELVERANLTAYLFRRHLRAEHGHDYAATTQA